MRRHLILACIAAAAAALMAPPTARAQSVLDEIKQRGELRVAGVLYRPLIARRPNGDYVGMDVEVMKRMAADLGVKLTIVNAEWATVVPGVETKKWDIVPALCITDRRKESIDFTESYITIGGTLVSLANNPKGLTTVAAFNRPDVVFAVPSGAWSEAVAKEVAPNATLKGFAQSTSADLLQEVIAGRADAVVLDTPNQTTTAMAAFGDRIRIVPGHNQPLDIKTGACKVGYGYMKGDTKFAAYLDGFTKKLRESGQLAELQKQFYTAEQIRGE
ncbi:MAG: transporter substrate-binding domain-containing protein [Alphaproteobacteria bacterium]|nr:transporter substrate-binding domain-containing protein [Alphaproteobacteria bacterium]